MKSQTTSYATPLYDEPRLYEFGNWSKLTLDEAPSPLKINQKAILMEAVNTSPQL